jgi:hypothetical protein
VHIEQDACRGPAPRHREQRCSIGKAYHLIAARRQDQREGFANGGIVIDYKYLTA